MVRKLRRGNYSHLLACSTPMKWLMTCHVIYTYTQRHTPRYLLQYPLGKPCTVELSVNIKLHVYNCNNLHTIRQHEVTVSPHLSEPHGTL